MGNVLSLLTKLRCFLLTGSVAPQYLTAPPVEFTKLAPSLKEFWNNKKFYLVFLGKENG